MLAKLFTISLFLLVLTANTATHAQDVDFDYPTTLEEYNKLGTGILLDKEKKHIYQDHKVIVRKKPEGFNYLKQLDEKGEQIEDSESYSSLEKMSVAVEAYQKKEYKKALDIAMDWARKDNPQAQEMVGLMYKNGLGTDIDNKLAFTWLMKAAENGKAPAAHNIGVMFFFGTGVNKNMVNSLKWLNIAVAGYNNKEAKSRAIADRANVEKRMSKKEIRKARDLAKSWISGKSNKAE